MAKLNPALEAHYSHMAEAPMRSNPSEGSKTRGVAGKRRPKMKQNASAERIYSQLADQIAEATGQFK